MKFLFLFFLILFSSQAIAKGTLTQIGTFSVFCQGAYQGFKSAQSVKEMGDFGLGTLDGLDGEMVMVSGNMVQIPISGIPRPVASSETIPFAAVIRFVPDQVMTVNKALTLDTLKSYLETQMPDKNAIYAIKISGTFSSLTFRSVPKQSLPYPDLGKALSTQKVWKEHQVKATAVGFWSPSFLKDLGIPGFHFHFISEDGQKGGHVLDGELETGSVELQKTDSLTVLWQLYQ